MTALEQAVCKHLGIDPETLVSVREVGGKYRVLWDEGIKGTKVVEVDVSEIEVPKPAPKRKPSTRRKPKEKPSGNTK